MEDRRPVTLLIAAMGGEGGGVMTDWLLAAARELGYVCQNTAIPGVAQRTGATTYYLEILPVPAGTGEGEPTMALYPQVGDVDVMVATELVEAGRACQNGYVTPDRTTLIASVHRVYTMAERTSMGDGRLDPARVEAAVRALSQRAILADFDRLARESGAVINAVIMGALAGSGALPIPAEALERAIRAEGKSVEANLRGFRAGMKVAQGDEHAPAAQAAPAPLPLPAAAPALETLRDRIVRNLPEPVREIALEGAARAFDYQDAAYAALYLDQLDAVVAAERGSAGDLSVSAETARHLALWMTYEDVIRVAQIKTRAARMRRLREGAGAGPEQTVVVTEFLKPGLDELCSILPSALAGRLLAWAERGGRRERLHVGLRLRTSTILGFSALRLMAALKPWRRRGHRFAVEQALIERWLAAIRAALAKDRALAREIAECARLVKGYADTHRRGLANFERLMALVAEPALKAAAGTGPDFYANAAGALSAARRAALADPEGRTLDRTLAAFGTGPP